LVIYDEGRFAYSFHGTDPAGGKLLNAFDLVRIHKFGDLDDDSSAPVNQLPSYKEMIKFVSEDDETKKTTGLEQIGESKAEFADDDWLTQLERHTNTGQLKLTIRSFELMLENDPNLKGSVGLDELHRRIAVVKPLPWTQ